MTEENICANFEGVPNCLGWSYCATICYGRYNERPPIDESLIAKRNAVGYRYQQSKNDDITRERRWKGSNDPVDFRNTTISRERTVKVECTEWGWALTVETVEEQTRNYINYNDPEQNLDFQSNEHFKNYLVFGNFSKDEIIDEIDGFDRNGNRYLERIIDNEAPIETASRRNTGRAWYYFTDDGLEKVEEWNNYLGQGLVDDSIFFMTYHGHADAIKQLFDGKTDRYGEEGLTRIESEENVVNYGTFGENAPAELYITEVSGSDVEVWQEFIGVPNAEVCDLGNEGDEGGAEEDGDDRGYRASCLNLLEPEVRFETTNNINDNTYTIRAYRESDNQLLKEETIGVNFDYEKICRIKYVYGGQCSQVIKRREIKRYRLATVTLKKEFVTRTKNVVDEEETEDTYQYRVRQVGNLSKLVFPGKTVTTATYEAFSERTLTSKTIGKWVRPVDQEGERLLEEGWFEGVNGAVYGENFNLTDEFLATEAFPIIRWTVNWENGGQDLIENPPEGTFFYQDGFTQVIYRDSFDIFVEGGGTLEDLNLESLWEESEPEDFNIFNIRGKNITRVEEGEWQPLSEESALEIQEVIFYSGDEIVYIDYLKRGTEDKYTYIQDSYSYSNEFCAIYYREENEFVTVAEEIKPLILQICDKLEELDRKVTKIEGALDSLSFPAVTWEVPTVGLGDPELGTVNDYSQSEFGLQNTINQLGLLFQGVGLTVAHNKSTMADIGMAIGAAKWREEYQVPKKARVPFLLRRENGEDAEEQEIEDLTQLMQWYIYNFDSLISISISNRPIKESKL